MRLTQCGVVRFTQCGVVRLTQRGAAHTWRIEGTYDTGREGMRWHEGFVIRYQISSSDGRARRGSAERYQLAYQDGMCEWIDQVPEPGIAFRKPGSDARVSQQQLQQALAAHPAA